MSKNKSPYGYAGISVDELASRMYMPSTKQGRFSISKVTPSAMEKLAPIAGYAGQAAQGVESGSYTQAGIGGLMAGGVAGGAIGGAIAGGAAGSALPVIGTAIGAGAGFLSGLIATAKKKKKPKQDPLVTENMELQNKMMRSSLIDKQNDRDWASKFRRAARYR